MRTLNALAMLLAAAKLKLLRSAASHQLPSNPDPLPLALHAVASMMQIESRQATAVSCAVSCTPSPMLRAAIAACTAYLLEPSTPSLGI